MDPQNIFGDCEILPASTSLQVSLKYVMEITALNNNLLLLVPLCHFSLCKNICVSANTPNHCSFCFVWHSSAHFHRKKKGNSSENTWPGDSHGTAMWWQRAPEHTGELVPLPVAWPSPATPLQQPPSAHCHSQGLFVSQLKQTVNCKSTNVLDFCHYFWLQQMSCRQ